MEGYLDVFWKMLLDLNLPEFADPLKRCRTVTELDPDRTRQCLISLKAEIAQSKRHSIESQGLFLINSGGFFIPSFLKDFCPPGVMEKFLPGMLSLHGINKTVDLFLNVDFQSAFEALYHFRKTHDAILPSNPI